MLSDLIHPAISDIDELISVHGAIWVVFIGQYKYITQPRGLDKVEMLNSLLLQEQKVARKLRSAGDTEISRTKGCVIICKQKVEHNYINDASGAS